MLRTTIALVLLLIGTVTQAQETPDALVREFKKSLDKNYTEKDLGRLFNLLDSLQVFTSDIEAGKDSIEVAVYAPLNMDSLKDGHPLCGVKGGRAYKSVQTMRARREIYYLPNLKKDTLYKANIKNHLLSTNQYQRATAYRLIGETSDTTFATLVTNNMASEKEEYPRAWIVMAVAKTTPKQTSALFDFLVQHEDFEDAHMLPT